MSKAILTIDAREPLGLVAELKQKRATMIAMQRAARSGRVPLVRDVRLKLGVKAKTVRDRIRIRSPKLDAGGTPFVAMEVDAQPLDLTEFRAVQLKRAGVRAKIGGRTERFRGAFIAEFKGRRRAARRKSKSRVPTRPLYGPSIANGVEDRFPEALARFEERFPQELFRALRYARGRRR